jgi:hypothetical protein
MTVNDVVDPKELCAFLKVLHGGLQIQPRLIDPQE